MKLSGLTVSEQISIIDVTLACLVSWLEGHSLAQTVFTNLYFQKPYEIKDAPLKAFCICIYKIIEAIRDFANRLVLIWVRLTNNFIYSIKVYKYIIYYLIQGTSLRRRRFSTCFL